MARFAGFRYTKSATMIKFKKINLKLIFSWCFGKCTLSLGYHTLLKMLKFVLSFTSKLHVKQKIKSWVNFSEATSSGSSLRGLKFKVSNNHH